VEAGGDGEWTMVYDNEKLLRGVPCESEREKEKERERERGMK